MSSSSEGGGVAAQSVHRHQLIEAMTLFLAPLRSTEPRWSAWAATLAAVLMAWEDASTLGERFSVVRGMLAGALPRRRKLGRTYQGFAKALLRHGSHLIDRVTAHLRAESLARCGRWRRRAGFEPIAVDGSRFDAPRTIDNESALGTAGRAGTHPQMTVTVAWHMGLGVPWAWRVGRADAAERTHLREMINELPRDALLVVDAGFTGYELTDRILGSGRHVLLRVGSNVTLRAECAPGVLRRGGTVWLGGPRRPRPLALRLIVVPTEREPVYLLTDIRGEALTDEEAARLYARRWGVEVFYRQAKQTMDRRKMRSTNAARAILELHWTLIGIWLLMLLNAAGLASRGLDPLRTSVAQAARVVRGAMRRTGGRARSVLIELAGCVRDDAPRRAAKKSYRWPYKKRDPRPKPPKIRHREDGRNPAQQRTKRSMA